MGHSSSKQKKDLEGQICDLETEPEREGMTRDGEDREERLQFTAAPTVVFEPSVLCIADSDAGCISHGAQPLGLLDQLVNLLLHAYRRWVQSRKGKGRAVDATRTRRK